MLATRTGYADGSPSRHRGGQSWRTASLPTLHCQALPAPEFTQPWKEPPQSTWGTPECCVHCQKEGSMHPGIGDLLSFLLRGRTDTLSLQTRAPTPDHTSPPWGCICTLAPSVGGELMFPSRHEAHNSLRPRACPRLSLSPQLGADDSDSHSCMPEPGQPLRQAHTSHIRSRTSSVLVCPTCLCR